MKQEGVNLMDDEVTPVLPPRFNYLLPPFDDLPGAEDQL
jgi:hypothetical protein